MQTDLQLTRPVDVLTLAIIREVQGAAAALGHPAMLVGATARIILVEHVCGLATGRATKDVDFAFAMESWEQFETLRARLITLHGFKAHPRVAHKLFYCPNGEQFGIPVDLVPFGALSGEREEIHWPPEKAVVMNVAGFADALESAVSVALAPDLSMTMASLPAMAVLKLFAWLDRSKLTTKDAADLAALLLLYYEVDQHRVYTIPAEAFEAVGFDIELGGAWLMGNDARKLALPATAEKLLAIFADTGLTNNLTGDMARTLLTKGDPDEYAAKLLEQFKEGFAAA